MQPAKRSTTFPDMLFRPIEIISWAAVILGLLIVWWLPLPRDQEVLFVMYFLLVTAYLVVFFHLLVPKLGMRPTVHAISTVGNIAALVGASYLLGPYGIRVDLLYVVVIAVAGIVAGRRLAFLAAGLAVAGEILVSFLGGSLSPTFVLLTAMRLVVYLAAGWLTSTQAGLIRQQAEDANRHNAELAFLLQTSEITSSSLDLSATLPRLAEQIAKTLPATFARICLFGPDGAHLVTYGLYPLRPLNGLDTRTGDSWSLQDAPRLHEVIRAGRVTVLRDDDPTIPGSERQLVFPDGTRSLCVVPLIKKEELLGIILVGEARRWEREPFDERRIGLLQTMARQTVTVIQNARLHETVRRQGERFAVLTQVGQAVGSTIELDDLLELIHQQLDRVIPSDTYFVALYDEAKREMDLRILLDEGQRFPRERFPLGQGFAARVVSTKRPLLVRHFSLEKAALGISPVVVGKDKRSESWLGAPMMIGDRVVGLLAVASYRPYAFDEDDMALLSNVAQQAALAVDNARHHAEVEERAQRDSLTGAFNHGRFLTLLGAAVAEGNKTGQPVSLIMLDVDRFKSYNDHFGHVVGDTVLRLVVQAIGAHLREGDAVGRWGGEEFAILLPNAGANQAYRIAQDLRTTLASLPLFGSEGQPLPKPTISQGIATYPDHAASADDLVVVADRALYRAKARGRDQIRLAELPTPP